MPKVQEKTKWVQCSKGHAPPGTLVGGHDINGEPIYVARASHNGSLLPGKLIASHQCAYVPWNGFEFKKEDYEVLVGSSNKWVAAKDGKVPREALPGGKTYHGEILYIGRIRYNGAIITGKIQGSDEACYISYGGRELKFFEYEVLIS